MGLDETCGVPSGPLTAVRIVGSVHSVQRRLHRSIKFIIAFLTVIFFNDFSHNNWHLSCSDVDRNAVVNNKKNILANSLIAQGLGIPILLSC